MSVFSSEHDAACSVAQAAYATSLQKLVPAMPYSTRRQQDLLLALDVSVFMAATVALILCCKTRQEDYICPSQQG